MSALGPEASDAWTTFRNAGLLWWVNRGLHLFGWSIFVECDDRTGKVTAAYPGRSSYRGFTSESEERGFQRLSAHIANERAFFEAMGIDTSKGGDRV